MKSGIFKYLELAAVTAALCLQVHSLPASANASFAEYADAMDFADALATLEDLNSANTGSHAGAASNTSTGGNSALCLPPLTATPFSTFSELGKKFVIFIAGKPLLTEEYIESTVEEPGTLNVNTSRKLEALPNRLFFELMSATAQNASVQRSNITPDEFLRRTSHSPYAQAFFNWRPEDHKRVESQLKTVTKDHFSSSEQIDLEVTVLSRMGILPSAPADWDKFKDTVVKYDGWILLGVLAEQAATNKGRVSSHGSLFKVRDGKVLGDWYVKLSDVGVNWKPLIEAGLRVGPGGNAAGSELYAGISKKQKPEAGDEKLGLNMGARVQTITLPQSGFTIDSRFNFHRTLDHTDAQLQGRSYFGTEIYARKARAFGSDNVAFTLGATVTHDFKGATSQRISLGLDNLKERYGGSAIIESSKERNAPKPNRYVGFAFGGNISWSKIKSFFGQ